MPRIATLVAVAVALAAAPCNGPQSPPSGGDPAFHGAFDGGTLQFRLEQGAGSSPLELVARDLQYDPATEVLTVQVALRNTAGEPVAGPAAVFVADFDPPEVWPLHCPPDCAGCLVCAFDHSGSYGDDGVLAPGETSEPRPWAFHDPGPQSFAFRARIPTDRPPQPGIISGVVFLDHNGDGRRDPGEPGMPGRPLQLRFGDQSRTTQTGADGRYAFEVGEPGLYVVDLLPAEFCVETTPTSRTVLIVRRPDGTLSGYDRADFGCRGDAPPDSAVDVRGTVFEDLDRNGVRSRGERGLPGVLVVGSVPSCPTFAPIEARTDMSGAYAMRLPGCPPPYILHREPISGFVDTSPNPLVFERRTTDLVADFGVAPATSGGESFIEGVVFDDRDRDGTRDADEPRLAGVDVWAAGALCLVPIVAHTQTDVEGRYRLRGADIHCRLPWIVRRGDIAGQCDTTPNPVNLDEVPGDPAPVFRVDFGSTACAVPAPAGAPVATR